MFENFEQSENGFCKIWDSIAKVIRSKGVPSHMPINLNQFILDLNYDLEQPRLPFGPVIQ